MKRCKTIFHFSVVVAVFAVFAVGVAFVRSTGDDVQMRKYQCVPMPIEPGKPRQAKCADGRIVTERQFTIP